MSALPTEAGGIEAMARSTWIFELTFERHIPGLASQRSENLASARDELMELKRQECAGSRAATLSFREADARQECLEPASAGFDVDAAIF